MPPTAIMARVFFAFLLGGIAIGLLLVALKWLLGIEFNFEGRVLTWQRKKKEEAYDKKFDKMVKGGK